MKNPTGEMPFLDHLEELRKRILWSVGALILCAGLSLWLVYHYELINVIQAPYLKDHPEGLTTLTIAGPWGVYFTVSIIFALVLASPVILYQLWLFLSPALMPREKKAIIPTLYLGLILFLIGAWVSWTYLLPFTLEVLQEAPAGTNFNQIVTWDSYFWTVVLLVVAIGLTAEVPLVMTILAALGLIKSKVFRKGRRAAIVANLILGAIISPGQNPIYMFVVTGPLIALYELGILGAWVMEKRAVRAAAKQSALAGLFLLILMGGAPETVRAQDPPVRPPVSQQDTARRVLSPTREDSLRNKRLGIPLGPTLPFKAPDSVASELLKRKGYQSTLYRGDSAYISATDKKMRLMGNAAMNVDGQIIEGSLMTYDDKACEMVSTGQTRIFDPARQPAVANGLKFDTCLRRSVLFGASTRASEGLPGGDDWFMRGNLAVDSSASRLFMGEGSFTTCDFEMADYYFKTNEAKMTQGGVLVARPAVLYVYDVPLMWLPFLFQDTKRGRHSGILIPKFGINDIVRPSRGYNRQVTDFGYYWATSEYMDVEGRINWYANRYIQFVANMQYKVRDRDISGNIGYARTALYEGGGNYQLQVHHTQKFGSTATLLLDVNLNGNVAVTQQYTTDPNQALRQVSSSGSFTKTFSWGGVSIGGTRSQELGNGRGTMSFPSLSISPQTFGAFSGAVTWSPSLTFSNTRTFKTPLPTLSIITPGNLDTLKNLGSDRTTQVTVPNQFTIGRFTLPLNLSFADRESKGRVVVSQRVPDPDHPGDSLTVNTVRNGDFFSSLNWDTQLNLPTLFQNTLNIVPSVRIANISPEPYMIRAPGSNGEWVAQAKRLEYGLSLQPTFYSFLDLAVGPAQRFRYTFAPSIQVQYSPEANLPERFAQVVAAIRGGSVQVVTPPRMEATVSLRQEFAAKLRPASGDTVAANVRRPVLFSLTTSAVGFDFEQDKLPGRTGWKTSSLSNDLKVLGFGVRLSHDLWQGVVGTDSAVFKPFLTSVSFGVNLSGNTFRSFAALLGLGAPPKSGDALLPAPAPPSSSNRLGSSGSSSQFGMRGFSANVQYSLTRARPNAAPPTQIDPNTGLPIIPPLGLQARDQSSLNFRTEFSPTSFWRVSWSTMYNVTRGRFESQSLDLVRNLHDWQAKFNFQKTPTGNFTLNFSIALIGMERDIKFDYNQTTIKPTVP